MTKSSAASAEKVIKKGELQFAADLRDLLKEKLQLGKRFHLELCEPILHDATCVGQNAGAPLKFGFLEQDVVIFRKLAVADDLRKCFLKYGNRAYLAQPLVVLELKYGSLNSHQLLTYSSIAGRIKQFFPECRYYLVARHVVKMEETLLRHSFNFDRIFIFGRKRSEKPYRRGDFGHDLAKNTELMARFKQLVRSIKKDLKFKKLDL